MSDAVAIMTGAMKPPPVKQGDLEKEIIRKIVAGARLSAATKLADAQDWNDASPVAFGDPGRPPLRGGQWHLASRGEIGAATGNLF